MLGYLIVGIVISILLSLIPSSPKPTKCDGDCYTCSHYHTDCQGNQNAYDFYEYEEDDNE